jgi:hypothetical protein
MMRRDDVLLALPGAPVVPLHGTHQAVAADLVGDVVERHQQLFSHQLHGDRRFHADQRWWSARCQIGHQLDVDAVPWDRLNLEFQPGRVLLRPLVHRGHRDPTVRSRLAPHAHGAGFARLRAGGCARECGQSRCRSAGQELSSLDHVCVSPGCRF